MPRPELSKKMEKYLDELHYAEFGYYYGEDKPLYPKPNPARMVHLLSLALQFGWYKNAEAVAIYLGYEDDDRIDTLDGCKSIIQENIKSWRRDA